MTDRRRDAPAPRDVSASSSAPTRMPHVSEADRDLLRQLSAIRADATLSREERYNASDILAELTGLPVLDRGLVERDCEFHELCSPYMEQAYAHDARCPMSRR